MKQIHVCIDDFVENTMFKDEQWWDSRSHDFRPWKATAYNVIGGASEWLRLNWPFCRHEVIDDHCMMPEHRYCALCWKRQPHGKLS